ncbi:hypothetical protein [Pseudomonas putida]
MTTTINISSVPYRNTFLTLLALLLSGVVAGVIFPLTVSLAGYQDADGVLTALMSTDKLTWYFWGQDRLLNTLPALASPVTNVEANLHFQVFLRGFFAYLGPIGILIFFTRSLRFLTISTAIANLVLVVCLSRYGQFNLYVQHNMFGTSLVLFAIGYVLTYSALPKPLAYLCSLLVCCLTYATNYALLIYTVPFLSLLALVRPGQRKDYIFFLAINCLGILIAHFHSKLFGDTATSFGISPSFEAVLSALAIIYDNLNAGWAVLFFFVSLVCLSLSKTKEIMPFLAAGAVACGMIILLASTEWLKINLYNIRYFITSEIILASLCGYAMTCVLLEAKIGNLKAFLLCATPLLASVFTSLGGFNKDYKELVGAPWRANSIAIANIAVNEKARVVAGGFWDVWPVIYEIQRIEDGRNEVEFPQVFGGAYRGYPLASSFLEATKGKGNQVGLCFLNTGDECLNEMKAQLRLPAETVLKLHSATPLLFAEKPLLKLNFSVE